jgi:hypothetical protein
MIVAPRAFQFQNFFCVRNGEGGAPGPSVGRCGALSGLELAGVSGVRLWGGSSRLGGVALRCVYTWLQCSTARARYTGAFFEIRLRWRPIFFGM